MKSKINYVGIAVVIAVFVLPLAIALAVLRQDAMFSAYFGMAFGFCWAIMLLAIVSKGVNSWIITGKGLNQKGDEINGLPTRKKH